MSQVTTLPKYKAFASITTTDATRDASLEEIIEEVNQAITNYVRRPLGQATYTRVLDAPPDRILVLPYAPVSPNGLQVWYYAGAKGDPSAFTSDHLLTRYTDYDLEVDQPDGTSLSGHLTRENQSIWGGQQWRGYGKLAGTLEPLRGSVKVTWTAGYAPIPADIRGAANRAVSKVYAARKLGAQPSSGSLNGASYSLGQSASEVLADPAIAEVLNKYMRVGIC